MVNGNDDSTPYDVSNGNNKLITKVITPSTNVRGNKNNKSYKNIDKITMMVIVVINNSSLQDIMNMR